MEVGGSGGSGVRQVSPTHETEESMVVHVCMASGFSPVKARELSGTRLGGYACIDATGVEEEVMVKGCTCSDGVGSAAVVAAAAEECQELTRERFLELTQELACMTNLLETRDRTISEQTASLQAKEHECEKLRGEVEWLQVLQDESDKLVSTLHTDLESPTKQIMLTVPDRTSGGTVLNVKQNGLKYKVAVPEGLYPGDAFTADLGLHNEVHSGLPNALGRVTQSDGDFIIRELGRAWNSWRVHAAEQQQRTQKLWFAVLKVTELKLVSTVFKWRNARLSKLTGELRKQNTTPLPDEVPNAARYAREEDTLHPFCSNGADWNSTENKELKNRNLELVVLLENLEGECKILRESNAGPPKVVSSDEQLGLSADFIFGRRVYQCTVSPPGVGYRFSPVFADKVSNGDTGHWSFLSVRMPSLY